MGVESSKGSGESYYLWSEEVEEGEETPRQGSGNNGRLDHHRYGSAGSLFSADVEQQDDQFGETKQRCFLVNLLDTKYKLLGLDLEETEVVSFCRDAACSSMRFSSSTGSSSSSSSSSSSLKKDREEVDRAERFLLVLQDGTLMVWDLETNDLSSSYGTKKMVSSPVPLNLSGIISVDNGDNFNIALTEHGHLYSWGNQRDNVFGVVNDVHDENDGAPKRVSFPSRSRMETEQVKITQACCGSRHILCLDSAGRMYSWGDGDNGRLGHGNGENLREPKLLTTFLDSKVRIIQVSAGAHHSIALSADCRAFSWGSGMHGKLGHGSTQNEYHPREIENVLMQDESVLVPLSTQNPLCHISAGLQHSALVSSSGYLFTFGEGSNNKLGHEQTKAYELIPRLVTSFANDGMFITGCVCSDHFTLAITSSGKLSVAGRLPRDPDQSSSKSFRFLELQSFDAIVTLVGKYGFVAKQRRRIRKRKSSMESKLEPLISEIPPIPPLSSFTVQTVRDRSVVMHQQTRENPQFCGYHAVYGDRPLSTHLRSGYVGKPIPPTTCPQCYQEMILSLSKQLKKQSVTIIEMKKRLEVERKDARAYRELCMRKENTENAVKMFLTKLDTLELHSSVMHDFAALIRDTVEGLHARILQLESANEALERRKPVLVDEETPNAGPGPISAEPSSLSTSPSLAGQGSKSHLESLPSSTGLRRGSDNISQEEEESFNVLGDLYDDLQDDDDDEVDELDLDEDLYYLHD